MKQSELRGLTNPCFKIGDRVIHNLTGQKMTIKRLSDKVATLVKDIHEPWKFGGIEYPGDTAVCLLDNLTHEEVTRG